MISIWNRIKNKFRNNQHYDDYCVDHFAHVMKTKLAKKRDEGRHGWEDKDQCSNQYLSELLIQHVLKGDPVDVANIAMMIHERGEIIMQDFKEQDLTTGKYKNKTVQKISGSWWEGEIVGFYSTWQTPIGYAIQLNQISGPVQIYPAKAIGIKASA